MARVDSINILLDPSGKDMLAERYGVVIENVMKGTISGLIKNVNLSGNPDAGSVEAKRFVNVNSDNYGTARTAGAGKAIKALPVTVKIDQRKEIVEELEQSDADFYGVEGLINQRTASHSLSMIRELERAFFNVAGASGAVFTTLSTDIEDIVEELIQAVETTSNDYVDGVPRDMLYLVCSPAFYGQLRTYLDTTYNANVMTNGEEIVSFHGVKVFSSVYLPENTNAICMAHGAVAQPVKANTYIAEKIPLSEALALELFYYYGTTAVMPDLIQVYKVASTTVPNVLGVTSVKGAAVGSTQVTIDPDTLVRSTNALYYKLAASTPEDLDTTTIISTGSGSTEGTSYGWTLLPADGIIASVSSNKIVMVVEADGTADTVVSYGYTDVIKK